MKAKIFLLFLAVLLIGCSSDSVKNGDTVKVEYTGSYENGEIFDTSVGKDPLTVNVGKNEVIKGFEKALIGMKVNEEKEVTIAPAEGYGVSDPKLIVEADKNKMPANVILEVGSLIYAVDSLGNKIPATITEIKNDKVILDLNHPLAGKTLKFKIKVIKIN